MTTPIDLAIVTILDHEFHAVRRRLGPLESVTFPDESLVYHQGRLPVANSDHPYSVILVRIPEPGNVAAAIAVKSLLQRWAPNVLLVVGISAGVPNVTALGDIVVSNNIVYYESGKIHPDRIEIRPKPVPGGPVFWNKARGFAGSDWRDDIGVAAPDGNAANPAVHIGTIASGEHVVDSLAMMEKLADTFRDLKAVAMEGYGASAAILDQHPRPDVVEIRCVCDLGSDKKDKWQLFAADAAAAFAYAFFSSGPISPRAASAATAQPLRAFGLQSCGTVNFEDVRAALTSAATTIQYFSVDLMDGARAGDLLDPQGAAKKLLGANSPLVKDIDPSSSATALFGQVHIPLAALAGGYLTDRTPVSLVDFHRTAQSWLWPAGRGSSFPALSVGEIERVGGAVAVVRVAVSYPIERLLLEPLGLPTADQVALTVPEPHVGCVRSEQQVRAYASAFRSAFDELTSGSAYTAVHVFYAGPVSLAIALGQAVSLSIHPPVIFWNYRQGAYDWGLDLQAAIDGRDCIVRPLPASQGTLV